VIKWITQAGTPSQNFRGQTGMNVPRTPQQFIQLPAMANAKKMKVPSKSIKKMNIFEN